MADSHGELIYVIGGRSFTLKELYRYVFKYSMVSLSLVFMGVLLSFHLYPYNLPVIPEPGRLVTAIDEAVQGDMTEMRLFLSQEMNGRLLDEDIERFFKEFLRAHPPPADDSTPSVATYTLPSNGFSEMYIWHPILNQATLVLRFDATGRIIGLSGVGSVSPSL
jgi:hypothetical protein